MALKITGAGLSSQLEIGLPGLREAVVERNHADPAEVIRFKCKNFQSRLRSVLPLTPSSRKHRIVTDRGGIHQQRTGTEGLALLSKLSRP